MKRIDFDKAYYIKLGKNGEWEISSIIEKKMRIGWPNQTLNDINNKRWKVIKKQLELPGSKKGVGTKDYNALRIICESTVKDIWITFHSSKLWWSRVGKSEIYEDKTSKYRRLSFGWHDQDVNCNVLLINQISGKISKLQGFRGTVCKVIEKDVLYRILNDESSLAHSKLLNAKINLEEKVEEALRELHWKDFENLVDLAFRNAGWRRISLIGETMKFVDIELEEPITGDLYQVQIKSRASVEDFKNYASQFNDKNFRKFYFVVHSPDEKLKEFNFSSFKGAELILPKRLSKMIVDTGLTDWLANKIK